MQASLRKQFKKHSPPSPVPQTKTTGLFQSVMSLVLQNKSNAAIKAALPNTLPQILSVYIASCKATIQSDNFFTTLKRMKGIK